MKQRRAVWRVGKVDPTPKTRRPDRFPGPPDHPWEKGTAYFVTSAAAGIIRPAPSHAMSRTNRLIYSRRLSSQALPCWNISGCSGLLRGPEIEICLPGRFCALLCQSPRRPREGAPLTIQEAIVQQERTLEKKGSITPTQPSALLPGQVLKHKQFLSPQRPNFPKTRTEGPADRLHGYRIPEDPRLP